MRCFVTKCCSRWRSHFSLLRCRWHRMCRSESVCASEYERGIQNGCMARMQSSFLQNIWMLCMQGLWQIFELLLIKHHHPAEILSYLLSTSVRLLYVLSTSV